MKNLVHSMVYGGYDVCIYPYIRSKLFMRVMTENIFEFLRASKWTFFFMAILMTLDWIGYITYTRAMSQFQASWG